MSQDGSYTEEDVTALTDHYIGVLKQIITDAMRYRAETLLGYNSAQGAGVGGVVRSAYYFDTKQYKLMFVDNATNKDIILKRMKCAAIMNGEQL